MDFPCDDDRELQAGLVSKLTPAPTELPNSEPPLRCLGFSSHSVSRRLNRSQGSLDFWAYDDHVDTLT